MNGSGRSGAVRPSGTAETPQGDCASCADPTVPGSKDGAPRGECPKSPCNRHGDCLSGVPLGDRLRELCQEAIQLRHTLYYGIDYGSQPDLSEAANRLGGVLAKMERELSCVV